MELAECPIRVAVRDITDVDVVPDRYAYGRGAAGRDAAESSAAVWGGSCKERSNVGCAAVRGCSCKECSCKGCSCKGCSCEEGRGLQL